MKRNVKNSLKRISDRLKFRLSCLHGSLLPQEALEGVEPMTVVEWCVSGAKDLRFIRREFHKREEELRNDRSANLSRAENVERERHR